MVKAMYLVESNFTEIVLHDHIGDCIKDKGHIVGIGGTGDVGVDVLPLRITIAALELHLNVSGRFLKVVLAC